MKPGLLLTLVQMLLVWNYALALPAFPGRVIRTQPDGSKIEVLVKGDEHHHWLTTTDGRPLAQDAEGWLRLTDENQTATPAQAVAASDIKVGNYPTVGEVRGLIILTEFTDAEFTNDPEYFKRILGEDGCNLSTPMGSAQDYFRAQSGGLFRPTFDVVGPVKLDHPTRYYGANMFSGGDIHINDMIKESCQKANDQLDVDFSQYDCDNDGRVDMVFVVFAGYGENYGAPEDCIWPMKGSLKTAFIDQKLDGKQIDVYACVSEIYGATGTQPTGIGTFCHEYGHILGLMDHYNSLSQGELMTGRFDIMDLGCYNDESRTPPSYTAFERYTLGWLEPEEVSEPALDMTLAPLATANQAYLLSTPNPDEFFMLENRQSNGWDAFIPGQGLMISHIDYDAYYWAMNIVNAGDHPRYCIVAADGVRSYDDDETDLYPIAETAEGFGPIDSFTSDSSPAAQTWDGQAIGRDIYNIRLSNDGVVLFDFMEQRDSGLEKVVSEPDSACDIVDILGRRVKYPSNIRGSLLRGRIMLPTL